MKTLVITVPFETESDFDDLRAKCVDAVQEVIDEAELEETISDVPVVSWEVDES